MLSVSHKQIVNQQARLIYLGKRFMLLTVILKICFLAKRLLVIFSWQKFKKF